ncbi:septum formation initiator family protein [Paenibacillus sp. YYML68]|uniref:septum formation initiator family protein n=1 Tax=Paenibacillus sp. YYML68 TaxID=2909250 RepID=UPI00248FD5B4|nr:septum formation initiator family protein [Paenibacillus sp. YYML68]
MPAYIHGNLAVEQRTESPRKVKVKETKRVVYRSKSLPMQEKLLYLFTVVICVIVAGTIIWRYAQIYEMSASIKAIEQQVAKLEAENSILKQKLDAALEPHRMLEQAKQLGFSTAEPGQVKNEGAAKPKSASATQSAKPKSTAASSSTVSGKAAPAGATASASSASPAGKATASASTTKVQP